MFRVLEDADAVARQAAAALVATLEHAARESRRACVVLSGGSSPRRLFELLAREYVDLDWPRLDIFFGDERAVPPDHVDSNYRMARETLLDLVAVGSDRIHPMPASEENLDAAARRYEETIREHTPTNAHGLPVFDLIWLGMGDDGHTASLFPGTAALEETRRWVVGNNVPQLDTRRMTLTYPVLDSASHVQFLVTGPGKAAIVRQILAEGDSSYPAARVRPTDGKLEWLLDGETGRDLASRGRDASHRNQGPDGIIGP